MKKLLQISIIFVLFFSFASRATSNSYSTYNEKLFYTAKVWGYVKYFHSEVAAGNVNWDNVLLTTLPKISPSISEEEFNQILLDMIRQAGSMKIASTNPPHVPEDLRYNLDIFWIYDPIFSESVMNALDSIQAEFRPQNHYLVGEAFSGGNPTFDNDDYGYQWGVNLYPDQNHRLLALFRYWNIINYFYPYKYMMDQNWDSTLVEFVPKICNATDKISYHLTFLELATRINDSHAVTYSETINGEIVGRYYLPLKLKFVENKTVVFDVHSTANIKVGDIITAINGQNIQSYRDSLKKYVAGSNPAAIERNINRRIVRGQLGTVDLTLETQSGEKQISIQREFSSSEYNDLFVKSTPIWEILATDSARFGYVDMGRLEVQHIDTMFSDLWETDGIIFDIRNYPKGTMWDMVKYLFDGPIHIASFTVPDIRYPGTLFWHHEYVGQGDFSLTYNKPIYILFDETTQSQAEYTVMAFEQHPKAVKIGSQTSGADGNVSYILLPGGIYIYFTGLGTFYPDKTETQRIGIIPDIEVHPTIAGIREGRDELLEVALSSPTGIGVRESGHHIASPHLFQNYPNPFNPTTAISYQLPVISKVNLSIYNILGQKVATLVNEKQPAGTYKVEWNASRFASGMYFIRFESATFIKVRKCLLLK